MNIERNGHIITLLPSNLHDSAAETARIKSRFTECIGWTHHPFAVTKSFTSTYYAKKTEARIRQEQERGEGPFIVGHP